MEERLSPFLILEEVFEKSSLNGWTRMIRGMGAIALEARARSSISLRMTGGEDRW